MTAPRHMLSTFDIKPTQAPAGAKPDELMINWATMPQGAKASFYMPGLSADDILTMAARINGYQPFTRLDPRTVGCDANGIAYIPIPRAPGNIAGLIDVALPPDVRIGDKVTIAVNQITSQSARIPVAAGAYATQFVPADRNSISTITWRRVTGTFKLALKVQPIKDALPAIERNLSLLRWIFSAIPSNSRWYPIFERYLEGVAAQVSTLGGDPATISPSGTGTWLGGQGDRHGIVGKVEGLIFDHFGDFEGFIVETELDERFHFYSREKNLREVVERAWTARLRVTVIAEDVSDRRVRRIVLHQTPQPL
jgi:hypothetical protein